jgi:nucleotide-binding universal stress UspA family protein
VGAYRTIVVGTDGSDTSYLAVERAGAIAADSDATLVIVSAYEPAGRDTVRQAVDTLHDEAYQVVGSAPAEDAVSRGRDHAAKMGARTVETVVREGQPVDVLRATVKDRSADLLVVGNVGLNTLHGRLLGSVPSDVARKSGVDVLIVHTS